MWKQRLGNWTAYTLTGLFLLLVVTILVSGIYVGLFLLNEIAQAAPVADPNQGCLTCHGNKNLSVQREGRTLSLYLDKESYGKGAHSALACTTCHTGITGVPHENPVYGAQLWAETSVACAACHKDATEAFQGSVHAAAGAGQCAGCHGDVHSVLPAGNPASPVARANVQDTCTSCHGGTVAESYRRSFHGIAMQYGYEKAPGCVDCHGSHDIVQVNDPASRVSPANVGQVCVSCHGGEPVASWGNGKEHVLQEDRQNAFPLWITWKIFLLLILFDILKDGGLTLLELFRQLRELLALRARENHRRLGSSA